MKKLFVLSASAIALTGQLLVSQTVIAKDYYVHAGKGRNTNSGAQPGNAFGDLTYAMKRLKPGDTLYVRAGTYPSIATVSRSKHQSGSASKPIRVKAYGSEKPRITTSSNFRLEGGISHWHFEGLTFQNAKSVKLGAVANGKCASFANNIRFIGNTFQHSSDDGIILNCARDVRISNNKFWNLRSRKIGVDKHAVLSTLVATRVVISNNQFIDIGADGVQLQGADVRNIDINSNTFSVVHPYRYRDTKGNVPSSSTTRFGSVGENAIDIKAGPGPISIIGNKIHGFRPGIKSKQDSSGGMGVGIIFHQKNKQVIVRRNHFYDNVIHMNVGSPANGAVISHNVFGNVTRADSRIYGSNTQIPKNLLLKGARNIDLYNNVFHNDNGSGKVLLRTDNVSNLLLKNNVFRNGQIEPTSTRYVSADYNAFSGITKSIDNMFKGPRDVNSSALKLSTSNWTPNAGSPLIDAGMMVDNTKDFYGVAVRGSSTDIGAAESQSATSGGNTGSDSSTGGGSSGTSGQAYVKILDYSRGDNVSGTITVKVDARDPDGIRKVILWANDEKINEKSSNPYEFRFDTYRHGQSNCAMFLRAESVDNKGNRRSEEVKLWVNRCQAYVEG